MLTVHSGYWTRSRADRCQGGGRCNVGTIAKPHQPEHTRDENDHSSTLTKLRSTSPVYNLNPICLSSSVKRLQPEQPIFFPVSIVELNTSNGHEIIDPILTQPMNLPHPNLILHPALLHALLLYVQDRLIEVLLRFAEFTRDGERPCDIGGVVRVFAPSIEEEEFAGSEELVILCVVDDTGVGAASHSSKYRIELVRSYLTTRSLCSSERETIDSP